MKSTSQLILSIGIVSAFLTACHTGHNGALPIYGNGEMTTKLVDGKSVTDTVYHIPAFSFINQYGDSVTNKDLTGKIYVADFFFTSCPSICPVMHRNMLAVYNEFKNESNFKILSHSIDPKYDSVAVLKKYADKLGVNGNTWMFLQGKKEDTYKLASSYLSSVIEDKTAPGGYVHQGYFILIDKQKRIRGTYDGTLPDQVTKLIADIKELQTEPDQTLAQ